MGAPLLNSKFKYKLKITRGPDAGQEVVFEKDGVTIGRGPENDFVISGDPKISRRGAQIKLRDGKFLIVNLSDKNYVMVNSEEIKSEMIDNSSVIQLGDSEIRFELLVAPPVPAQVEKVNPSSLVPHLKVAPPPPPSGAPAVGGAQPLAGNFGAPVRTPANNSTFSSQPINYQTPPRTQSQSSSRRRPPASGGDNSRLRFYGIVAIVGAALYLFFTSGGKPKVDKNAFKSTPVALAEMEQAEKRNQELLETKKGRMNELSYNRAQEHFIKGFRDFNQGQYGRARDSFQVVLNLDPENQLARRYYHLASVKFEEFIKFNMMQGNRYREKKNWRMCQSNFSNVMTMLQYQKNDPTYKQAKQYYDECMLNLEGRY